MTTTPARARHAATPPWRNVRVLRVLAQLGTLAVVLIIGWWLVDNLFTNMRQTRLSFGFEFLDSTAGFEIGETLVPCDLCLHRTASCQVIRDAVDADDASRLVAKRQNGVRKPADGTVRMQQAQLERRQDLTRQRPLQR